MQANRSSRKSRAILKAIAEGHSFERILADNSTVNYHDIFRAAGQVSARQPEQKPVRAKTKQWPKCAPPLQEATLASHTVLRTCRDGFEGTEFAALIQRSPPDVRLREIAGRPRYVRLGAGLHDMPPKCRPE